MGGKNQVVSISVVFHFIHKKEQKNKCIEIYIGNWYEKAWQHLHQKISFTHIRADA